MSKLAKKIIKEYAATFTALAKHDKGKKPKEQPKLYIVRKFVRATSVLAAIRKERTTPVHEVYVDETFKDRHLEDVIGFHAIEPEVEEEGE